jgi:hypothetical protein
MHAFWVVISYNLALELKAFCCNSNIVKLTGLFSSPYLAANGKQPGDPERASAIFMQLAESEQPPLHLYQGQDAYNRASEKLAAIFTLVFALHCYKYNLFIVVCFIQNTNLILWQLRHIWIGSIITFKILGTFSNPTTFLPGFSIIITKAHCEIISSSRISSIAESNNIFSFPFSNV